MSDHKLWKRWNIRRKEEDYESRKQVSGGRHALIRQWSLNVQFGHLKLEATTVQISWRHHRGKPAFGSGGRPARAQCLGTPQRTPATLSSSVE